MAPYSIDNFNYSQQLAARAPNAVPILCRNAMTGIKRPDVHDKLIKKAAILPLTIPVAVKPKRYAIMPRP